MIHSRMIWKLSDCLIVFFGIVRLRATSTQRSNTHRTKTRRKKLVEIQTHRM